MSKIKMMILTSSSRCQMIEIKRIIDKQFRDLHSNLQLVEILEIALPIKQIHLEVEGEVIKEISPTTEYVLRFLELGISTVVGLSEALGLQDYPDLAAEIVSEEISAGNVRPTTQEDDTYMLTVQGRETLRDCLSRKPKNFSFKFLFDTPNNIVSHIEIARFKTRRQLQKYSSDLITLETSQKSISLDNLELPDLNKLPSQKRGKERTEIQSLRRLVKQINGFFIGYLLVYAGRANSDFVIVFEGERGLEQSLEFESMLRSKGGLSAIGIEFSQLSEQELKDVETLEIAVPKFVDQTLDVVDEFDASNKIRKLKTYEHPEYLQIALTQAEKRVLIFSPWISKKVVNDNFTKQLESTLRRGVLVTIAWGFGIAENNPYRETEQKKNSKSALEGLIKLKQRYSNFSFILFKDDSHQKILIADDFFINTSFNWLSFKGDIRLKIRLESGLLVTDPKFVDASYEEFVTFSQLQGRPMSKELIPSGCSA